MVAHLWWTPATDIYEGGRAERTTILSRDMEKHFGMHWLQVRLLTQNGISLQAELLQLFKYSKHKGSTEDINPAPYNFQSIF